MFELPEEHRMLQDLVAKFIDRDVIPLEKSVLAREAAGQKSGLPPEDEQKLLNTCKELGLWGLDVPEEFGGANLPYSALLVVGDRDQHVQVRAVGRECERRAGAPLFLIDADQS